MIRPVIARLAWKEARADRQLCGLVALLVAVPVLASSFAAVAQASALPSTAQRVAFELGRANAIAFVTEATELSRSSYATVDGFRVTPVNAEVREPASVQPGPLLPAGARALPAAWATPTPLRSGRRAVDGVALTLDIRDPLTSGIVTLSAGRAPDDVREVTASTALASRLHLRLGSQITLGGGTHVVVVGLNRRPSDLGELAVVMLPGTLRTSPPPRDGRGLPWLVALPAGVDEPGLERRLLARGILLTSRSAFSRPASTNRKSLDENGVLLLGVAMFGLVEVVCIAGAAFAVGIRRRRGELVLLAANGATSADVRALVVSQGVVMGGAGTAMGLASGVGLVAVLRSVLERKLGHVMGPLRMPAMTVGLILLLGVGASLLSAMLPARQAAALSVTDGLGGSRPRMGRGRSWVAALLLVLGVVGTGSTAVLWQHASHRRNELLLKVQAFAASGMPGAGRYPSAVHDSRYVMAIVVGSAVAMAGVLGAVPLIMSRLSGSANLLPVTTRIAMGNMARNPHRVLPVIAALMAAAVGATTLTFVTVSSHARLSRQYTPLVPVGDVLIASTDGRPLHVAQDIATARRLLPVRTVVVIPIAVQTDASGQSRGVEADGSDRSCSGRLTACRILEQVAIGDGALGVALKPDGEAPTGARAVTALDPRMLQSGRVTLRGLETSATAGTLSVPANSRGSGPFPYAGLPGVLVTPALAARQGWSAVALAILVRTTRSPTTIEEDTARSALSGPGRSFDVERGYAGASDVPLILLAIAAGFVTLAGTCVTIALSLHEQRRDMATMLSVGASPRQRRLIGAQQSALLSVVAVCCGVLLGSMLGAALILGASQYPFVLPLRSLVMQVGAGALLAASAGGLLGNRPVGQRHRY